jgi:hypothetical protein
MKELSTSEKGRRGGRGGGAGRSYLGGGGSSSMMNVGTGLITISSSLAISAAVTTEGTSAGRGVSTGLGGETGALAGTFTVGVRLARSARIRLISWLYVRSSILASM